MLLLLLLSHLRADGECGARGLLFYLFIYLFLLLAVLGLRCCMRAFSTCGERGLLSIAVGGLRIAVASRRMDFSSCGTWAQ